MKNNLNWDGLPEVLRCTEIDEKGKYNLIDGYLFPNEGGHQQIAKVYVKKDGKHEVEFLRNVFSTDETVQQIVQEAIEMQDRGLELLNRRVKTNNNLGLCYKYHQLDGSIDDYSEEKEKTRDSNGNIIFSGKVIKYYYILFNTVEPKPTNNLCKGLWLTEEYFNFID